MAAQPQRRPGEGQRTVVHLIGEPYVQCGDVRLRVPQGSKKLLAFVALRAGRVERLYTAGTLWPFCDEARATGNLRSALWRMRRADIDVVVADKWSLALDENVTVDVNLVNEWANRFIHGNPAPGDLTPSNLPIDALDLLPGWYDDWAIIERERTRQRVLHAMEALARQLTERQRFAEAVDVAMAAMAAEPLRESAQRVLLEAQLSQGNWAEAEHSYTTFRMLMITELGIEPSRQLAAFMQAAARGQIDRRKMRVIRPAARPSADWSQQLESRVTAGD
jgi:DNA-binding SARP family transcriptional activator